MAKTTHPKNQVNPKVFDESLWDWISENKDSDSTELRLKYGAKEPYHSAIAQIEAWKKYGTKFQELFESRWIFPLGLALEQSSSLATAHLKVPFFDTPYSADLCAGMGIDSLGITKRAHLKGHLCFEKDQGLARLLESNLHNTEVIASEFEIESLKNWIQKEQIKKEALTVYLDPDRRASHLKTHAIEDGSPNLVEIQSDLLHLCKSVIAKHSPMLDLRACNELRGLKTVIVVQHMGECKEIITIQAETFLGQPSLILADATSKETIHHDFPCVIHRPIGGLTTYIIQPLAGLNKSELHGHLAQLHQWNRLGFGNLYTSNEAPALSPFYKIFKVHSTFESLKKVKLSGAYAIESVGSKMTAIDLRKRLKLKEGRNKKLFYLQNGRVKLIVEGLLME